MNRRGFLTSALKATAVGLLAPEWALEGPLKGRSMVSLAGVEIAGPAGFYAAREFQLGFTISRVLYVDTAHYDLMLRQIRALRESFRIQYDREAALCADERTSPT